MKDYAKFLNQMPVIPDVTAKVLAMVDHKDFSYRTLEETILLDPGLTAKILRVSNSALYARPREISSLMTAITLLGMKTIKNLVILLTGANLFNKAKEKPFYKSFWRHSLVTAFMARDLAGRTGQKALADDAFIAGLLHNIGQTALFFADQEAYSQLLADSAAGGQRISQLEEERFGANHKLIGSQVLNAWNFPKVYIDVALEHGNNNITSEFKQIVILVSAADFMTTNLVLQKGHELELSLLSPYFPFLGLGEADLKVWQSQYWGIVTQDKLFQECQTLFQI